MRRTTKITAKLAASAALATATLIAVPLLAPTAEASTYPLHFTKVYYNSPGSDTGSNASLNAEYVTIKNGSSTARSLTGYTIRDKANHVYRFGTFTLGAGKSVRIHTGTGTNTSTDRYWGSGAYIWNNTGDKAYLRSAQFTLRDTCEWGSGGPGYINC
jgi:Lamin Tail Domain